MKRNILTVFIGIIFLSGCSAWFPGHETENRKTSSLVNYLYADGGYTEHKPETPVLKLPVKVGIAFIPPGDNRHNPITLQEETALLSEVRTAFLGLDYIDRIEIIPSTYLANGQGFTTLEQLSRLYDIDLIALVSYDQISRTSTNSASLLYWTIVGAYVIPGNSNTTQTFVDTSVFDIATRKLLFRAPGVNKMNGFSTAIGITTDARKKSNTSFKNAVADMSKNLEFELSQFKSRVRTEKIAKVKIRKGYSRGGAGAFGAIFLILLALPLVVQKGRRLK